VYPSKIETDLAAVLPLINSASVLISYLLYAQVKYILVFCAIILIMYINVGVYIAPLEVFIDLLLHIFLRVRLRKKSTFPRALLRYESRF
jgi:hypothetical protein